MNFAARTILFATLFNSDGGTSGGSKLDVTAMLPGMLGGYRGVDPNVLALMNGNGGFGGQNGIWGVIYLAIVASIFGWNNGGFGGFGGRGGNGLPAELAGNAGRELLMQAIQGNASAINQIASTLNCSSQQIESALCNIQNSIGLTGTQIINAIQSGDNGIVNQLSTCCCNILQAVERQGAATQLQNCQNMNTLTREMNDNTRDLPSHTRQARRSRDPCASGQARRRASEERDTGRTAQQRASDTGDNGKRGTAERTYRCRIAGIAERCGRHQVQAAEHGKRAIPTVAGLQSRSSTCCGIRSGGRRLRRLRLRMRLR